MLNKKLPLPSIVQGTMGFGKLNTYPLIQYGKYENFFQKFVAESEDDLVKALMNAKKYGQKAAVKLSDWVVQYITSSIQEDVHESDYVFVVPNGMNLEGGEANPEDTPHYFVEEINQCMCSYAQKCEYHIEGATEPLPPPSIEYVIYAAFIPKDIYNSLTKIKLMGPLSKEEIFCHALNLPIEALIELSIKINAELRNRDYAIPEPDEVTEQGLKNLELQLLK